MVHLAYLNAKATNSQLWIFQVHLKQNASRAKERAILLSANSKPSNSPFIFRRPHSPEVPLVNEAHSGLLLAFIIL